MRLLGFWAFVILAVMAIRSAPRPAEAAEVDDWNRSDTAIFSAVDWTEQQYAAAMGIWDNYRGKPAPEAAEPQSLPLNETLRNLPPASGQ